MSRTPTPEQLAMGRTKLRSLCRIVQRVHLASPPATADNWEGEGWYYECVWGAGGRGHTTHERCDSFRERIPSLRCHTLWAVEVLDKYEAGLAGQAAAPPAKKQRAAGPRVYEVGQVVLLNRPQAGDPGKSIAQYRATVVAIDHSGREPLYQLRYANPGEEDPDYHKVTAKLLEPLPGEAGRPGATFEDCRGTTGTDGSSLSEVRRARLAHPAACLVVRGRVGLWRRRGIVVQLHVPRVVWEEPVARTGYHAHVGHLPHQLLHGGRHDHVPRAHRPCMDTPAGGAPAAHALAGRSRAPKKNCRHPGSCV
eukprot:COSAG03_NODE_29_length_18724_cov_58.310497_4_plen_309_part_00